MTQIDRAAALKTLGDTDGLVTGLIYQDTTKPSFEKLWQQLKRRTKTERTRFQSFVTVGYEPVKHQSN